MDIRLAIKDIGGDITLQGVDLEPDDGLETAVVISLFTDRIAQRDDVLPDPSSGRQGWWGDAFSDKDADKIGSRLWLLSREKQLSSVLSRAREYAEESLQWLVEDGIAKGVSVTTEIVRTGVLGMLIVIDRPGNPTTYTYQYLWEGQRAVSET